MDLSKDILFLGAIGKFYEEVNLGTMTVFIMLELLISWRLGLAVEFSAVLSVLEQKVEIVGGNLIPNLECIPTFAKWFHFSDIY